MTSASDKRCGFKLQPNVVLEVVNTSIRILVVPGSNLRPETGITIEVFSWYSPVPPGRCRNNVTNRSWSLPFTFLPVNYLFIVRLLFNGMRPVVRINEWGNSPVDTTVLTMDK
jgi:hypothetical protein